MSSVPSPDDALRTLEQSVRQTLDGNRRSLSLTRVRESIVYVSLICCGIFSLLITVSMFCAVHRNVTVLSV